MPAVHDAARRLAETGDVVATKKGEAVDLLVAKGAYRLTLARQ